MGVGFALSLWAGFRPHFAMKAMKSMKSMKAMKAGAKSGALSAAGAYAKVAETAGIKPKEVKAAVEALLGVAASELKKNGSFKIGGSLNLKLKKKPAVAARKGVNPFTKEPCVFKAKPA